MPIDRRKKGCPNEQCEMHTKKVLQKIDNDFCPKCGTKLIFVCAKCFCEIEDTGYKHRICRLCEANQAEKRAEAIEHVKAGVGKVGAVGVAIVGPVVVNIANKVVKEGQGKAVKAGVKVAQKGIDAVFKK